MTQQNVLDQYPTADHAIEAFEKMVSKFWFHKDELAPPQDGSYFTVQDSYGSILYTVHWDGEDFMTDYECWSGSFTYWMPSLPLALD